MHLNKHILGISKPFPILTIAMKMILYLNAFYILIDRAIYPKWSGTCWECADCHNLEKAFVKAQPDLGVGSNVTMIYISIDLL